MSVALEGIDHIHIHVANREKAEKWYSTVFGFFRTPHLEIFAQGKGPLTLQNTSGTIHLALFERPEIQSTTVALKASAKSLAQYKKHLETLGIEYVLMDHQLAWSIYLSDPDGNPYEIITYEYEEYTRDYADK